MIQAEEPRAQGDRRFVRRYLDTLPFFPPGRLYFTKVLSLIFFLSLCTALTWAAVDRWGFTSTLKTRPFELKGTRNLSSLWFSPTGELLGRRQEGWKLEVLRWGGKRDGTPVPLLAVDAGRLTPPDRERPRFKPSLVPDKSAEYQNKSNLLLSKGLSSKTQRGLAAKSLSRQLPYLKIVPPAADPRQTIRTDGPSAIIASQDGVRAAWAWNGKLYVYEKGAESPVWALNLRPNAPEVADVAFTTNDMLLIQYADDALEFLDIVHRKVIRTVIGGGSSKPGEIQTSGSYALHLRDGNLTIYDTTDVTRITERAVQVPPLEFPVIALSKSGDAAVAYDNGTVLVRPPKSESDKRRLGLNAPGIVLTMAYSNGIVAVGGGFRGIYLLSSSDSPQVLLDNVTGPPLIAARTFTDTGGQLAFTTQDNTAFFVTFEQVRALNSTGRSVAWLYLLGTSGFLILLGVRMLQMRGTEENLQQALRQQEVTLRSSIGTGRPVGEDDEGPSIPLPDPPEELVKACASGACVGFLGAGMGAQAGLPTWKPLVEGLLEFLTGRQLLDPDLEQSLRPALAKGEIDHVADFIVSSLGDRGSILNDYLLTTFVKPDASLPRAYSTLKDLGLSAVLTTNFDNLLERTFLDRRAPLYTHRDAENLLKALSKKEFFLLQLYGTPSRPDSVLLAQAQYLDAMARNVLFSQFMEGLFFSQTILFLGASLEGIEAYLGGIRFPTSIPQKHYALVHVVGTAWRPKADLLSRRYGIEVLPYTGSPGFPELPEFMDRLSRAISEREDQSPAEVLEPSWLKSITLQNIGPFDELSLNLDRNWNVFLGDNGVGKSTVLKAIAVGICGEEAADYAGRLIKTGRTDATITLETNAGRKYITEIRRGDARSKINTVPSRPLEAEGWLTLGFPPLRTFTWARTKELSREGKGRFTAEDVLPLIIGVADPRLDTLKAWIFDLDYLDAKSLGDPPQQKGSQGSGKTRYRALRDEFFEVAAAVTPGLTLEFANVDRNTKDIFVKTDDGIVPIEAVSQGTQSLMGWVGVLLERLHDIYGTRSDAPKASVRGSGPGASPRKQFAIVLIDEIDAHMHPLWQKVLTKKLGELFPGTQFIATTHSPLIVSALGKQNVQIFARDIETGKVTLHLPDREFEGMRSDQILTSPLFRLRTTRSGGTVEKINRYSELLGKTTRTEKEEKEFQDLQAELEETLRPGETEMDRTIDKAVQSTIEGLILSSSQETSSDLKRISPEAAWKIRRRLTDLLSERKEPE
ncbi:MAG: AAA family ATPase [bacterium]|nr:AAA family ATPase [bacterium]